MNTAARPAVAPPITIERCDRCQARARVCTTFLVGHRLCELLWCGHHFTANEAKIRQAAVLLQDQRYPVGGPFP